MSCILQDQLVVAHQISKTSSDRLGTGTKHTGYQYADGLPAKMVRRARTEPTAH